MKLRITFRRVAVVVAALFVALSLAWMFAPVKSLSFWGVEYTESAGLVGRRGAAMYAGIAVMLFLARHAEPSPLRSALVRGILVSCALLAALGLFELATGRAQAGILLAVLIETAVGIALLLVDRGFSPRSLRAIK